MRRRRLGRLADFRARYATRYADQLARGCTDEGLPLLRLDLTGRPQ